MGKCLARILCLFGLLVATVLPADEIVPQEVFSAFFKAQREEMEAKGVIFPKPNQPPYPDTAVIVTENSEETHNWRMEIIKEAQHSIEISVCFSGGHCFRDMLYLIEERLREVPELQVHLITSSQLLESEEWNLVTLMSLHYGDRFQAILTSLIPRIDGRGHSVENHTKMVIVDGKYCVTGGSNLDDGLTCVGTETPDRDVPGFFRPYFYSGSRDMDCVLRGSIVHELRSMFYRIYQFWEVAEQSGFLPWFSGDVRVDNRWHPVDEKVDTVITAVDTHPDLVEDVPTKPLLGGPDEEFQNISAEYCRLIDRAEECIDLGHMWLHVNAAQEESLLNAVNKGVKLRVITNGLGLDAALACHMFVWPSRMNYLPLMLGQRFHAREINRAIIEPVQDVEIWEYAVPKIIYHKKVMTVDHKIGLIGSYNLSRKSDLSDYELTLTFHSEKVTRAIEAVLETDRQHSVPIGWGYAFFWYFSPVHRALAEVEYHVIMRLI